MSIGTPGGVLGAAIGTYISTAAIDVVGVFTQGFVPVFQTGRPIKADIKEDSKIMEHPLENGATIVDHRIILPIEIELSLLLPNGEYRNIYQEIKQLFLNGEILSVHTRTGVYDNQIIAALPHDESPDMWDTVSLALKLREVQLASSTTSNVPNPRKPSDSGTVQRGTQQGNSATSQDEGKASVLYGVFG